MINLQNNLESKPDTDGWENERDTERAKVNARWFAIGLLLLVVLWIRRTDATVQIPNTTLFSMAAVAIGTTLLEAAYLWSPNRIRVPRGFKYATVLADMAFITALIPYTGYTRSPFFFVYFVFLISNCLRYGLLMSLYVAAAFNVFYVLAIGTAPLAQRLPSVLGGEGVKIVAFWAVALYGGSISARLRRQANQLRVYEETIMELRREARRTADADRKETA